MLQQNTKDSQVWAVLLLGGACFASMAPEGPGKWAQARANAASGRFAPAGKSKPLRGAPLRVRTLWAGLEEKDAHGEPDQKHRNIETFGLTDLDWAAHGGLALYASVFLCFYVSMFL